MFIAEKAAEKWELMMAGIFSSYPHCPDWSTRARLARCCFIPSRIQVGSKGDRQDGDKKVMDGSIPIEDCNANILE